MLRFYGTFNEKLQRKSALFLASRDRRDRWDRALSKPLEWLLQNYQIVVLWGFAGAIIGTLPALAKRIDS